MSEPMAMAWDVDLALVVRATRDWTTEPHDGALIKHGGNPNQLRGYLNLIFISAVSSASAITHEHG